MHFRASLPTLVLSMILVGCNQPSPITPRQTAEQARARKIQEGPPLPHQGSSLTDYQELITAALKLLPSDEITKVLSIRLVNHDYAKVTTGSICGPLCGSGKEYWLIRSEGQWSIQLELTWIA